MVASVREQAANSTCGFPEVALLRHKTPLGPSSDGFDTASSGKLGQLVS